MWNRKSGTALVSAVQLVVADEDTLLTRQSGRGIDDLFDVLVGVADTSVKSRVFFPEPPVNSPRRCG
jgi:hypothetical protein